MELHVVVSLDRILPLRAAAAGPNLSSSKQSSSTALSLGLAQLYRCREMGVAEQIDGPYPAWGFRTEHYVEDRSEFLAQALRLALARALLCAMRKARP
ncbi:hypothetical protein IT41_07260 [Paracoccus halophilus]|uniref:Uncharacterized protein n=1 Tax=Paracoccus halophilus TaxID=376733 RepID=A0A099F4F3_9RHOB|nr:hypothetical protein [Paracoccus halophilus]KGJ05173.1 hypothetical protein IT41_07260 [Paracoccus halophilus]